MRWLALVALLSGPVTAETLVASRNLAARQILAAGDIALAESEDPLALQRIEDAIGLETRVAIRAGRAIRAGDLTRPTLVERNARVVLVYSTGGLDIRAEGRALARGAAGEVIRVMNLASKTTVSGVIDPLGHVQVGG